MADAPPDLKLLARLELLDNQYRSLRRIVLVALLFGVVFAILIIYGVLQLRSDAASRLTLRDEESKQRGALVLVNGTPALELYDPEQQAVVGLLAGARERGLKLLDNDRKLRGWLAVVDGQPRLEFFDKAGKSRVLLSLRDSGPELVLTDAKGRHIGLVPRGEDKDAKKGAK